MNPIDFIFFAVTSLCGATSLIVLTVSLVKRQRRSMKSEAFRSPWTQKRGHLEPSKSEEEFLATISYARERTDSGKIDYQQTLERFRTGRERGSTDLQIQEQVWRNVAESIRYAEQANDRVRWAHQSGEAATIIAQSTQAAVRAQLSATARSQKHVFETFKMYYKDSPKPIRTNTTESARLSLTQSDVEYLLDATKHNRQIA